MALCSSRQHALMASGKTTFAENENLAKLLYVRHSFASQNVPAASDKVPFRNGDKHAKFQVRNHLAKASLGSHYKPDNDPKMCYSCFNLHLRKCFVISAIVHSLRLHEQGFTRPRTQISFPAWVHQVRGV